MDFREPTDTGKKIGDYIKNLRVSKGYSPTQLSKRAGIARSSLSNLEMGRPTTIINMTKTLNSLDLKWADVASILDGGN